MIYSPDHNFLLLKNQKVGGTSLEVELSQVLPSNAIVTPILPKNNNHKPKNYNGFRNHMSYKEISRLLDLSNAKVYTIIRDPYYMVLSNFFYALNLMDIKWDKLSKDQKQTFVNNYFTNDKDLSILCMLKSTKHIYTIDNKIIIDKFIRYEDGIEDQINPILKLHGIPQISINTFEKQYRPKEIKPDDIFNDDQMSMIRQEWKWEFDNLGYNR
jgi:hypothetical protein